MKRTHSRSTLTLLAVVILAGVTIAPTNADARNRHYPFGTWYVALDAGPFGLPPGLSLPGIMSIHLDRTAVLVDGGDFGGLPFATRDSAQLGSWRFTRNGIRVVMLFLQADAATGDVLGWQRVHLSLRHRGRDTLVGDVNVFELKCEGPAPFPIFNCADPIENADRFEPASPPDVPVTLRRLSAR